MRRGRRLRHVAGRIRDDDIAEVREKARIDDVVSSYVTLKRAGGGSLKGLCPFHDEKSPSFNVNPSRGFFHCFGCQEGGDVISFLMKIDGLSFAESLERLADKYGVVLRREDGDQVERPRGPARGRLIEAHKIAQEYYAEQLGTPDALVARQFLGQRGFDQASAETFGVGFAPRDGEALLRHLRGRRFTNEELVTAGLVKQGRSHYDAFRGRLLWPIREASGETIGFGARRIFDDDRIDAKYLNTGDSPIYKKNTVLYGLDLARREIARSSQAVVVEGYTDVMACHLAGVPTAVATCGTAFGDDHARVLRRFLHDHEEFRGEVIFTFDGDAAGQKAALRAFGGDQNFVSQTYVAVEPDGLDPCDLRLQKGDAAVRELIATRKPLYRFVMGNVLTKYDLDRADGRVDALREAAGLVSSIRDKSKVDAFAREIAGMIGVDVDDARAEVRRAANRPAPSAGRTDSRPDSRRTTPEQDAAPAPQRKQLPSLRDPRFNIERETLKIVIQHPARRRAGHQRTRPRRLQPPRLPGGVGGDRRGRRSGGGRRGRGLEHPGAVVGGGPARVVRDLRARRRAGAHPGRAVARVRRRARLPPAGAHHDAAHRRPQVAPPAHQPGRAPGRVQQDVRRAGRPRAAPPHPARPAGGGPVRALRRTSGPDVAVGPGERVLAWCRTDDDRVLVGTRDALYVASDGPATRPPASPGSRSRPPTGTHETDVLRVSLVGSWGEQRVEHELGLVEPGRLLELVRERVTASVVLQRHVAARRATRRPGHRSSGPSRQRADRVVLRVRRGRRPGRPGGAYGGRRGPRRGPRRRGADLISQRRTGLASVLSLLSGPL